MSAALDAYDAFVADGDPDDNDEAQDAWFAGCAALTDALAVELRAMKLYGYVCPECKTWAEDMTPHCFNEHADDPVATLPFYVKAED